MRSMMLPLTSTLDGAESEPLLPSKMRTFWKSVALEFAGGSLCARVAEASPTAMSGRSVATNLRRDMEVMGTLPGSYIVDAYIVGGWAADAATFSIVSPT